MNTNSVAQPESGPQAGGTQPGTTFLTGKQAAQILEKLKVIKNIEGQTIKIQTIQTNPQTGIKKIVAIPLQTTSISGGGSTLNVSPLKTVKTTSSPLSNQGRNWKIASPRTSDFSNISISKASGTSASLQHQPIQGEEKIPGVTKLISSHSTILSNPTASTATTLISHPQHLNTIINSQSTVMSQQRITLTPQKSVSRPSSGTDSLPAVGQMYTAALSRNQTLEPGEFVRSKRPLELDGLDFSDAKRKKTDKGGKGLRHFSMKVCEKVKAKGTTSYNEVADELVTELTDPRYQSPSEATYDQKNIRRRVYDALNVLMAMNIISKEKKEIRWLGLPTNSIQEVTTLESEKAYRLERIKTKTKQLQDLILQQIAFKNLVERNRETENMCGSPTPNSAIQLPFIIVGTSKRTVIDCSISNDKMEYLFNFDNTFEIHDDMEVLKKMKMTMGLERGIICESDLEKAKCMVPRALQSYVEEMAKQGASACDTMAAKVTPVTIKTETDPLTLVQTIDDGIDEDSDE